ncbi:lysM and putative peptidoglycan-binding domain-containing protein 2 [Nematostella vectensis]|uniref:lysM and putative peptidoglycan-binding domain-containing protein 2 n=1 Tax=Nematostella vectensis TaxID=45351 RepID=UPI002077368D|nr:lysM and putative peptidoglycan-binding domain-containing protein 2 [Nematostella vectensis]
MSRAGVDSSSKKHHKNSPLLTSARKREANEGSSLSGRYESQKSYGSTTNPIKSGVDTKLVGHVLQESDTLQGLAIKYGVPMEDIRRVNKLWASDSLYILKIIKIPIKTESDFASLGDEEANCLESSTAPIPSVSKERMNVIHDAADENGDDIDGACISVNTEGFTCDLNNGKGKPAGKKEQIKSDPMAKFLSRLDSQIMQNVEKSEKLIKQSGPQVIQSLERRNPNSPSSDEDLFRPLSYGARRGTQEPAPAATGRFVSRARSKLNHTEDQFFEL